jgi:hypothetical protein
VASPSCWVPGVVAVHIANWPGPIYDVELAPEHNKSSDKTTVLVVRAHFTQLQSRYAALPPQGDPSVSHFQAPVHWQKQPGLLTRLSTSSLLRTARRAQLPAPSTFQPNASQPSTFQPNAPQPSTFQPNAPQPSTFQPNASQPSTSQPGISRPSTSQPNTSQPNTSQPNTSQPSTSQENRDAQKEGQSPERSRSPFARWFGKYPRQHATAQPLNEHDLNAALVTNNIRTKLVKGQDVWTCVGNTWTTATVVEVKLDKKKNRAEHRLRYTVKNKEGRHEVPRGSLRPRTIGNATMPMPQPSLTGDGAAEAGSLAACLLENDLDSVLNSNARVWVQLECWQRGVVKAVHVQSAITADKFIYAVEASGIVHTVNRDKVLPMHAPAQESHQAATPGVQEAAYDSKIHTVIASDATAAATSSAFAQIVRRADHTSALQADDAVLLHTQLWVLGEIVAVKPDGPDRMLYTAVCCTVHDSGQLERREHNVDRFQLRPVFSTNKDQGTSGCAMSGKVTVGHIPKEAAGKQPRVHLGLRSLFSRMGRKPQAPSQAQVLTAEPLPIAPVQQGQPSAMLVNVPLSDGPLAVERPETVTADRPSTSAPSGNNHTLDCLESLTTELPNAPALVGKSTDEWTAAILTGPPSVPVPADECTSEQPEVLIADLHRTPKDNGHAAHLEAARMAPAPRSPGTQTSQDAAKPVGEAQSISSRGSADVWVAEHRAGQPFSSVGSEWSSEGGFTDLNTECREREQDQEMQAPSQVQHLPVPSVPRRLASMARSQQPTDLSTSFSGFIRGTNHAHNSVDSKSNPVEDSQAIEEAHSRPWRHCKQLADHQGNQGNVSPQPATSQALHFHTVMSEPVTPSWQAPSAQFPAQSIQARCRPICEASEQPCRHGAHVTVQQHSAKRGHCQLAVRVSAHNGICVVGRSLSFPRVSAAVQRGSGLLSISSSDTLSLDWLPEDVCCVLVVELLILPEAPMQGQGSEHDTDEMVCIGWAAIAPFTAFSVSGVTLNDSKLFEAIVMGPGVSPTGMPLLSCRDLVVAACLKHQLLTYPAMPIQALAGLLEPSGAFPPLSLAATLRAGKQACAPEGRPCLPMPLKPVAPHPAAEEIAPPQVRPPKGCC